MQDNPFLLILNGKGAPIKARKMLPLLRGLALASALALAPGLPFAPASAASPAPAPAAFAVAPAFPPALALTPALSFALEEYWSPEALPLIQNRFLRCRDDFERIRPNVFFVIGGPVFDKRGKGLRTQSSE